MAQRKVRRSSGGKKAKPKTKGARARKRVTAPAARRVARGAAPGRVAAAAGARIAALEAENRQLRKDLDAARAQLAERRPAATAPPDDQPTFGF